MSTNVRSNLERLARLGLLAASTLLACGTGQDPAPAPAPASMKVSAQSGGTYDLANTTWTRCEVGWPAAGQSYWQAWVFGEGTATIRHEVYTASTDCTGATDPAQHFEVAMTVEITGGPRTVGWDGSPPAGCPATVTATGVTFTAPAYSLIAKGVAYVDDTRTPPWLFVTNPGDPPPPADADGYPTVLPIMEQAKL
ncbi:MAG: hypothetical protein WCC48_02730 [Anaeromyxobacteraceae bacterium]